MRAFRASGPPFWTIDRYLEMQPHADDTAAVRERRIHAQRAVSSLH
jgi:hypothetical protein